jgi:hypothetical protein
VSGPKPLERVLYVPGDELATPLPIPRAAAPGEPVRVEVPGASDPRLYDGYEPLLAAPCLLRARSHAADPTVEGPLVEGPEDFWRLCRHLALLPQEHLVAVAVQREGRSETKLRVYALGEMKLERGASNVQKVRHVVRFAALVDPVGVCVVQSRADCEPLKSDVKLIQELRRALDGLGVQLLDHLIVAPEGFCSTPDVAAVR